MRFRQFPLVCECGHAPAFLQSAGLTPAHELVIHWKCTACRRLVYVVKSLSDCWRESAELADAAPGAVRGFVPEDLMFLHSIGVKLPDNQE